MRRVPTVLFIAISTLVIANCGGTITCAKNEKLVSQCDFAINENDLSLSCSTPKIDCAGLLDAENEEITVLECGGEQIKLNEFNEADGIGPLFSSLPIYKRGKNFCSVVSIWGVGCQYTVKCNIFGKCKTKQENCTEQIEELAGSFEDAFSF